MAYDAGWHFLPCSISLAQIITCDWFLNPLTRDVILQERRLQCDIYRHFIHQDIPHCYKGYHIKEDNNLKGSAGAIGGGESETCYSGPLSRFVTLKSPSNHVVAGLLFIDIWLHCLFCNRLCSNIPEPYDQKQTCSYPLKAGTMS